MSSELYSCQQLELLETPVSNTGLGSPAQGFKWAAGDFPSEIPDFKGITHSLDAISLVWRIENPSEAFDLRALLSGFCGIRIPVDSPFVAKIAATVWDRCYKSPCGAVLMTRKIEGGRAFRLALQGRSMNMVAPDLFQHFLKALHQLAPKLKCTRIDIATDDYSKQLEFREICRALDAGEFFGFRTSRVVRGIGGKRAGWTAYIGSRQSDCMIRIYDKFAESNGRIDCIRYEIEYKDELAQELFLLLIGAATSEESLRIYKKYWKGKAEFRSRENGKNQDRNPRLAWWDSFVTRVGEAAYLVRPIKVAPDVVQKADWIYRQVAKSLAIIKAALPIEKFGDFLDLVISEGERKCGEYERIMVDDFLRCGER